MRKLALLITPFLLSACVFRMSWGPFDIYVSVDATPTQEFFATSTAQQTSTPMPTATATSLPSATPTPQGCIGTVTATTLNIRSGPGVENPVVTTLVNGAVVVLLGQALDSQSTKWYKIDRGWISAAWVTTGCNPPVVVVMQSAPASRLGLHLTVGASQDVVMAALPRLGSLKGTTGTENILQAARSKRPDLLILYRIVAPDCPPGWGSGDAVAVADSWWSSRYAIWQRTGLMGVVDAWEPINECGTPASAWENAFWLRTLDNARLAGLCLAVFSDSYGTPEILQFQHRAPVLNWILDHPCRTGRYHIMALHSYEGAESGSFKFGRYELFMQALGQQYRAIPIVFTEYSYGLGSPPVDCGALWADWRKADQVFVSDPQIWGVNMFNISPVGQWGDLSSCFK